MKMKKMLLFFSILCTTTLPNLNITQICSFKKYYLDYLKMDPSLHHRVMSKYLPMKQQEFETLYKAGTKRTYIGSQKLISLEKRRKSWPTERRKNYHAQLNAAENKLHQLSQPYKNSALTNLRNRINALQILY